MGVQAAVPAAAAVAAVGVAVVVPELDVDDDDGEEEAAALAPAPVAPVLLGDDAVQRLLLYVDLLRFRTELVHAFPRLVRDVI